MNGKNIAAGLVVSVVSVALAIGITYFVAFSGNANDQKITFQQQRTATKASPVLTGTIAANDPNITATPTSIYNCTFPMDIWLQYPDSWRINSYRLGSRVYTKAEMIDALRRSSDLTADRLLAQVFVVILNQQNGADATGIRSSFSQAVEWLVSFPTGSKPTEVDLQKADSLVNDLEKFNDGLGGPQPCQYALSEATPVIQDTLAPQSSQTVTKQVQVYITWTPSYTPAPPKKNKPAVPTAPPPPPPPTATKAVPTAVPTEAPPPPPTSAPAPTDVPASPQPQNTTAVTQPPQQPSKTPASGGFTSTPAPQPATATSAPPPTSIPPTTIPPTSPPPTSIPPTTVPPTSPPPTKAPATARPTKELHPAKPFDDLLPLAFQTSLIRSNSTQPRSLLGENFI